MASEADPPGAGPSGERAVPVGSSLFHGEALFLADQLRRDGVPARVWHDPAEGARREASYRVMVRPADLERALALRRERLDEEEAGVPTRAAAGSRSGRAAWIGATGLGVLGFATGARVGRHIHGGGPAALLVAIAGGLVGLVAGYLAGRAAAG